MNFKAIAKRIIAMKEVDLAFRNELIEKGELEQGYNKEIERLHIKHAAILEEIMDEIGYPTIDKIGEEGSEAAWLIIQHAISLPDFMRKSAKMLEEAVGENRANAIQLAYLTDRIAVFEGNPQSYGTQFDWDDNGAMSPQAYDDLEKVNERRASIGLNQLEEQIVIMRERLKNENQKAPNDLIARKKEIEIWKKSVGWIK